MTILNVPFPFLTIGLAQVAALPGDTIQLAAGYKNERVIIVKNDLTISGGATSTGIEVVLGGVATHLTLAGSAPISVEGSAAEGETIVGNAGDNRFIMHSGTTASVTGSDVVSGGAGIDTLVIDYGAAMESVVMSAPTGSALADDYVFLGGQRRLAYSGMEKLNITGGVMADVLYGGAGDDVIAGGDGADWVSAGTGVDIVNGGDGADILYGNQGNDVVNGDAGNDILFGGQGDDRLDGGAGDDILEGALSNDILIGGIGFDTASYVYAQGGVRVSLMLQGTPQDTVGMGVDTLIGVENITGGVYNDVLSGDAGVNVLNGGDGDDLLTGDLGADTLNGGEGADVLYGNQDDDVLGGGGGDDTLFGGRGADRIAGSAGADVLQGGADADMLTGGVGADVFRYMLAADSTPLAPDTITDFETTIDKIDLTSVHLSASDTFSLVPNGASTTLAVDLGGDGVIDMAIRVTGMITTADVLWG